jgi:hypothetical protein
MMSAVPNEMSEENGTGGDIFKLGLLNKGKTLQILFHLELCTQCGPKAMGLIFKNSKTHTFFNSK